MFYSAWNTQGAVPRLPPNKENRPGVNLECPSLTTLLKHANDDNDDLLHYATLHTIGRSWDHTEHLPGSRQSKPVQNTLNVACDSQLTSPLRPREKNVAGSGV